MSTATISITSGGTAWKRMLRTLMSLLAIFLAATFLAACGKSDDEDDDGGKSSKKSSKSADDEDDDEAQKTSAKWQAEFERALVAFESEEYEDAVKFFKKAAEKGSMDAQIFLGMCYSEGVGVEKDIEKALEWFRKAAKTDDPVAQAYLGGELMEIKEEEEGLKHLKKSADQGCGLGQFLLFCHYINEPEKVVKYLKKAAVRTVSDQKTSEDYFLMVAKAEGEEPYREILDGEYNFSRVVVVISNLFLAQLYANGEVIKKDVKEAKKCLERARKYGLTGSVYRGAKRRIDAAEDDEDDYDY